MVVTDRPIDADNHYYEPLDAFTRHLDPKFAERGVRVVQEGKRTRMVIGGRVNSFVPNPTFDPIIVPGCLDLLFRGEIPEDVHPASLMETEPLRAEYQDRDARIAVMDEQRVGAILLFPTLGCGVEEALRNDIRATMASISAFNHWLEEDWGFDYQGRIVAAPMLSLADPDLAVAEIDSLAERGARVVSVRPAPVPAPNGTSRSLGDRTFDPVWTRLADAGIPVAFHLSDSGYESRFATMWGVPEGFGFGKSNPLGHVITLDRAIHDTVASMIVDGVFARVPELRIASIENGSDWAHQLAKHMNKQANQTPWAFADDPVDTLRNHVWIAPYFEDDIPALAELIGVERILFGSDWPHGEGVAEPMLFDDELDSFDDAENDKIMRTNCMELLGLQ